MKKNNKWLAGLFCLILVIATVLGGCSSGSNSKTKRTKEVKTADGSSISDDSKDSKDAKESKKSKSDTTIEEQVLLDQGGIKITAKEYINDGSLGDGIKLLVENHTYRDYSIGCDALIVNDYMISDLFYSDIAAGKSSNETMDLYSSQLEAAGIDTVGKIEMYFHAYDSDYNSLFQNAYSEIHTSEFENMDTTPNDAGNELYNANGIRIVGKTVDENSFWGTAILLYCENNSGQNVGISVDDMSINGFMMSPFFSTTVYNGKKSIDDITIFSQDLEDMIQFLFDGSDTTRILTAPLQIPIRSHSPQSKKQGHHRRLLHYENLEISIWYLIDYIFCTGGYAVLRRRCGKYTGRQWRSFRLCRHSGCRTYVSRWYRLHRNPSI